MEAYTEKIREAAQRLLKENNCCAPQLGARPLEQLGRFGAHVGLAFHIQDDILDIEGDPTLLGKSTGGDRLTVTSRPIRRSPGWRPRGGGSPACTRPPRHF